MKRKTLNFTYIYIFLFCISFSILAFFESPLRYSIHKIKDISYFIPSDLLINDAWYGVYFGDKYIGYSHSFMKAQELKKGGGYVLKNKTVLDMPILGILEKLDLETGLILNKSYLLKEASLNLTSPNYFLKGRIKRIDKDSFKLSLISPAQKIVKVLDASTKFISSSFAPIFSNYLPLRKRISFAFFDPFLNKETNVQIVNNGPINLMIKGKEHEAIEFDVDVEGIKGKIYTDKKGYMIEQIFLGFRLLKEDPVDLFQKDFLSASFDLIQRFTVPSVYIPNKENIKYLKIKLKGVDSSLFLEDFNQRVMRESSIIEIFRKEPKATLIIPVRKEEMNEYLEEDNFIRFHSNLVEKTALNIIGKEKDALRIIELLLYWIDKHIKKIPTLSIPNSLDVLRIRQGDCGELSALLVGFLRSVGIPSYVNIGLVYQDGKFFYHAWASAFVGEWIDVDPALEQLTADATHIKLAKGLEGQFEIFKFIDNIKIDVLEFR